MSSSSPMVGTIGRARDTTESSSSHRVKDVQSAVMLCVVAMGVLAVLA